MAKHCEKMVFNLQNRVADNLGDQEVDFIGMESMGSTLDKENRSIRSIIKQK